LGFVMSFSIQNSVTTSSIFVSLINGTKKSFLYTARPDKWSTFTGIRSVIHKYNEK
jgi:hypothetical protein